MTLLTGKKIAIVYDRVNKWGGAERVLSILHKMFPNAPLYTSVYNPEKANWAKVFPKIHTSFLQKIPFAKYWHQGFGWLMPLAFENFDFSNYDLVISVTSEAAKGIITKPETTHVCYILTPTRYLWSHYDLYFKNPIFRIISKPVVKYLKNWDKVAAQRPDKIISISTEVQKRIKEYYHRDSKIIFPPVNIINRKPLTVKYGNYFLYVGRLVPYKRVGLLIEVFNKLKYPLIIIGSGSEESKLKKISKKNIKFFNKVNDGKLIRYYRNAKALIMPQEEDFGLVSIEAQSFGIPIIAFKKGGVQDTVIDGKTGILFASQSCEGIISAIAKFEKISFNHKYICKNAKKFRKNEFERQLRRSFICAYTSGRGRYASLAQIQK